MIDKHKKIDSKCLKFLKFCWEDKKEFNLTWSIFVNLSLGDIVDARHIGYSDGIAELGDYRKVN